MYPVAIAGPISPKYREFVVLQEGNRSWQRVALNAKLIMDINSDDVLVVASSSSHGALCDP